MEGKERKGKEKGKIKERRDGRPGVVRAVRDPPEGVKGFGKERLDFFFFATVWERHVLRVFVSVCSGSGDDISRRPRGVIVDASASSRASTPRNRQRARAGGRHSTARGLRPGLAAEGGGSWRRRQEAHTRFPK